jgi:hypothetical protein
MSNGEDTGAAASEAPPRRPVLQSGISILAVIAAIVLLWEGYKLVWGALEWRWPVRPDNRTMHTWEIVAALLRPAQRSGPILLLVEGRAALLTLREAVVG